MALETALAKVSLDITTRRDPLAVYHKMKLSEFEASGRFLQLEPLFRAHSDARRWRASTSLCPDFFKGQEALAEDRSRWTCWKTISHSTCCTSMAMNCPRSSTTRTSPSTASILTGAKEQRARWKRCVAATDGDLGEALGKAYVEKTFGAEGKQRTLDMVHNIEAAMGQDLQQLTWMTPATKQKARRKAARHHQQDRLSG